MFGDEREDYGAALQQHYAKGPPPDWPERFVTAYASSHPWEDFAETWAHYFHMVDTLETAGAFGITRAAESRQGRRAGGRDRFRSAQRRHGPHHRRLAAADLRGQLDQPQHGHCRTSIRSCWPRRSSSSWPSSTTASARRPTAGPRHRQRAPCAAIVAGLKRAVGSPETTAESPEVRQIGIEPCRLPARQAPAWPRGECLWCVTEFAYRGRREIAYVSRFGYGRSARLGTDSPCGLENCQHVILVGLHHVTRYQYDRPVSLGPQVIRLRPAPHCRTRVPSYSLKVTPAEHFVNWQQDPNGNWLARFVFPERTTEFSITVDLLADMEVINPFDFFVEPCAETFPVRLSDRIRAELAPYLEPEPAGPRLKAFLAGISLTPPQDHRFPGRAQSASAARDPLSDPHGARRADAEETLERAQGSCRDTAWLLVQVLRHLGLAARFVSGYLIQLKPDLKALDGPAGTEQDFTDLHAWTEVYLPGAGWIGLDPTSGLLCGEGHLPLARRRITRRRADQRRGRARRGRLLVRDERDPRSPRSRASPCRSPMKPGPRSMRSASGSMPTSRRRTCGSPWAASRPSSRSTTTSRPNGTPPRSGRPSACAPTS